MEPTAIRGSLRHLLLHPDQSNRIIAAQRGISPTTVGRHRRLIEQTSLSLVELEQQSDRNIVARFGRTPKPGVIFAVPDWDRDLLDLERGHNRAELHARYVENTVDGTPMAYRTYCKQLTARIVVKASGRIRHRPGEKMMVDFAGYCPPGRSAAGSLVKFQVFVAILPVSQLIFGCAVGSQQVPDWISAHEQMLRFYGGAPSFIVCDNLKAAVIERPKRRDPVIQPTFQMFCEHYGMGALPTRARRPKDKALVENAVKLIQRLLRLALLDRPPMTLSELNALLRAIIEKLNKRPLRRFPGETRASRFELLDRPALAPLPRAPFANYILSKRRKVPTDYHVDVEGVGYSVPHRLVGLVIELRATLTSVEVFHDGKIVALHPRATGTGVSVTSPSHMPLGDRAWRAHDEADLELWATQFSSAVQEVAAIETARELRGTVRVARYTAFDKLARSVEKKRFEAACARAIAGGKPNFKHIANMLENCLENAPLDALVEPKLAPRPSKNVRGATYYSQEGDHA